MSGSNPPVPAPTDIVPTAQGSATTASERASGQDFYKGALKALNGLFDLSVTTAIGHVSAVTLAETNQAVATVHLDDPAPKVASTVINTVTGDMTAIYSGDFASDPVLMKMHADALETARAIRKDTIDLLKTVIEDFKDLLNGKQTGQ